MHVKSVDQLRALYGYPRGRARDKQLDTLERHAANIIALSPFVVVSTHSGTGLVDCSPRGGSPGFVRVLNEKCLLVPDAKGNNRLDSLVNIIETGAIGCLFLIPGVDETLRVNGTAQISTSAEHLGLFSHHKKAPRSCIEISVKEVFLHCAKALMRSGLWSEQAKIDRSQLPTMGMMINDQLSIDGTPESQEDMVARYIDDL